MFALMVFAGSARADCLPKVELPKKWTACTKDSDCVLAGDGCRTCGNWLPVNAKYRDAASKKDSEARAKAQCAMTCEACAPSTVSLTCRAKRCTVASAVDGGGPADVR
jgi:hypothetical protein